MLTNVFATPRKGEFLTGVIYDDTGSDGYTAGDGTARIEISAGGTTTASRGAGGYTLELAGGPSVDVTLGSGACAMRVSVDMSGDNVKLDLIDRNRILTSGDIVLGTGAQSVGMLGAVDSTATGNREDNLFHVGRGDNTLLGGGGVDRAVFTGALADYDIDLSDPGRITISDTRTGPLGDGVNVLGDIDFADFSDTSLSFLTLLLSTLDAAPGGNTPLTFSLSDGSTRSLATDSGGKVALTVPEGMTGRLDTAAGAGDPAGLEVGDALEPSRSKSAAILSAAAARPKPGSSPTASRNASSAFCAWVAASRVIPSSRAASALAMLSRWISRPSGSNVNRLSPSSLPPATTKT